MIIFLPFTAALSAAGMGLLAAMCLRDDPLLGVVGLMLLCVAGITAAAYGVLDSAA